MKNKRINLIDIGPHSAFNTSMMFVQSVLENINAGYPEPVIDIDFVRSRDLDTVMCAFTASCDVMHVMAHGDSSEGPAFYAEDSSVVVSFEKLAAAAVARGKGISTGAKAPMERAYDAAERAIEAYSGLTDRPCPYKVMSLSPSRRAQTLLVGR